MRLFGSKIQTLTTDLVNSLIQKELIEVERSNVTEVELDIQSVLKEYLRTERAITEEAKDMAHSRGLDYSAHQKIKRQLAERRKFGLYEDSVGYIAQQIIETLLHTRHVEEIFCTDNELRAAISPILKKHMSDTDGLDQEVRKRIRNLQEGTADWEIRYAQTMERLKQARGE